MVNFNTSNPIIIHFPPFAGGKFISNCLSLSKHAVPQNRQAAEYLLNNPNDYAFRLDTALKSLPPKGDMINWIASYEYGDTDLYGSIHKSWRTEKLSTVSVNAITEKLSNSNLKFFICSHEGPCQVLNLLKVWPNATVIILKNCRKFIDIASQLKTSDLQPIESYAGNYCKEKYNVLKGQDWPTWEQFEKNNYLTDISEMQQFYQWHLVKNNKIIVDIDSTIFNKELFILEMKKLYAQLGFDDFDSEAIVKFWERYIALHIDIAV
jgi:hypothetical protein